MNIFDEKEWNEFRAAHPQLRFWQAMAAYLFVSRILIEYRDDEEVIYEDTFYWTDDLDKGTRKRGKKDSVDKPPLA